MCLSQDHLFFTIKSLRPQLLLLALDELNEGTIVIRVLQDYLYLAA